MTNLEKLDAAINASWEKNGGNPGNYEARRIHEQGFLDGMQYALRRNEMKDCIYYRECNGAGFCAKGLPNTPCDIRGCVAYIRKKYK